MYNTIVLIIVISIDMRGQAEKRFFDCTLFCDGDWEKRLLSTYRNMAILQILSQKPSLCDECFAIYDILSQFFPCGRDLGLLDPPKGATRQNQFFGKF